MENKKLEIDLFLKQIQLLSQTNRITPKQIYLQLINLDIPEQERNQNLSEVFTSLQNDNKHNNKMEVFVSAHWNYFCQFISKKFDKVYSVNPIKIYVPLKKQNLEQNVQKIFNFISQNDIEHCSKLSRGIRLDDLVIRVSSPEDANKIIEFINDDKELTNDMYNPNPFCIKEGKVGLAMDRILSYNDTLSKYIYDYINKTNNQNMFASYEGFKYYLQENLKSLQEKENISSQINMCEDKKLKRLPEFLQTLEEITNIIIKAMEGNTKESLYSYFVQINDSSYNESKYNEYKIFSYPEIINENNKLLKEIIEIIATKYGYSNTKNALETYRNTGNESYITRTNNAREKVTSSKTFRTYLGMINLEKEIENQKPKVKEIKIKTPKEVILEEVCKLTYKACQIPERGYCGKKQVARALIRMQANDYNCLTRANNARNIALENINPEEVKDIIKKSLESNGYIIENEADLYELYATHIEYSYNDRNMKRGKI